MKTIIFTDLDDTLFYSSRAVASLKKQGIVQAEEILEPASYTQSGQAICFSRPKQTQLIHLLKQADHFIPVTGRSSESLARVCQPSFNSFRISSHGAMVYNAELKPQPDWLKQIKELAVHWSDHLDQAMTFLKDYQKSEPELRIKKVYEQQICTYISIKGPEHIIKDLYCSIKPIWAKGKIHYNQRNLALLPSYSDKATAVNYLMNHFQQIYGEELLFIGVGDSVSDLSFLKLCDFVITPQTSQIHRETWL